jgi:subtilisin family serine protease
LTAYAIGYAVGRGVIVVAAMGNEGWGTAPSYPAAFHGVLAVGAVDRNHNRSIWPGGQGSNQGSWISVAAPGTDIPSLRLTGGVVNMSGTSQAAAHVSGVLALLLSSPPTAPGVSAVSALTSTCEPLGDSGTDPVPNSQYGYGLVNAKAALDAIHPPADPAPADPAPAPANPTPMAQPPGT